jgi:hypothetical protein
VALMVGLEIEQVGGLLGQVTVTFASTVQASVVGYWIASWVVPVDGSWTANDAVPPETVELLSSEVPSKSWTAVPAGAALVMVTVYWNPFKQLWSVSSATVSVDPLVGAVKAVA